jgi:two-component system CAI-1 autoinducer sensor kinase/phosphatase CqsS
LRHTILLDVTMLKVLSATQQGWQNFNYYLEETYQQCGAPGTAFGIYLISTFGLMLGVEYYYQHHLDAQDLARHFTCVLLAGLLLFKPRWPEALQPFYALFFYACVFFVLPLSNFLYMFQQPDMQNHLSNLVLVVFILLLVTDWHLFVAMMLAALAFALLLKNHASISLAMSLCTCYATFNTMLWLIFTGMFFSRYLNRNREQKRLHEQLNAVQSGGFIAHELRTPLSTIKLYMQGLEKCLPEILQGYQHAQASDGSKFHLQASQLALLQRTTRDIQAETNAAFNVIDMLLVKINRTTQLDSEQYVRCDMNTVVQAALARYPFAHTEQARVHWQANTKSFYFMGNVNLTVHVLFNLLRNALQHIAHVGKGEVTIFLEQTKNASVLVVRDTGPGIAPKNLRKIFSHHYSASERGIGLGLNFCQAVMRSYKGRISCQSTFGNHTEFRLFFPFVSEQNTKAK